MDLSFRILQLPFLFIAMVLSSCQGVNISNSLNSRSETSFCNLFQRCNSTDVVKLCFPQLTDSNWKPCNQSQFRDFIKTCINQVCEIRLGGQEYDILENQVCNSRLVEQVNDIRVVNRVCDTCVVNESYRDCQAYCRNDHMQTSSTALPICTNIQEIIKRRMDLRCKELSSDQNSSCEVLLNLSSTDLRCGREVTTKLVDNCVNQFFNTCMVNNTCRELPFFNKTFCSSPKNAMLCGEFCRRGGPRLLSKCEPSQMAICIRYLNSRHPPESEAEEQLLSSSLLNFTPNLFVGTIASSIRDVVKSAKNRGGGFNDETSVNILEILDLVFSDNFAPRWLNRTFSTTMEIVSDVNDTLLLITEGVANDTDDNSTFTFRGSNVGFDVVKFRRGREAANFTFPSDEQRQNFTLLDQVMVTIPFTSPCYDSDDDDDCYVTIGISVIDNFAEYITESIYENSTSDNDTLQEPDSALLSVVVQNTSNAFTEFIQEPIIFQFIPKGNVSITGDITYQCNFLDSLDSSLSWSTSGLKTNDLSDGRLEVSSDHLTSFAILASPTGYVPTGIEGEALKVVSYIGCAISIICLSLTIVILLLFRKKLKKGVLLYVHLNLAISLLLAMVVFVAGVDYASFNSVLCVVVAAMIQYFFLCAFFWMLGEGVMLYLLIVRVFGQAGKRWYLLLPLCWGVPVPIVAISAGILRTHYISHNTALNTTYCWIDGSPEKAAIWTFLGPVIIVVCVNAVMLAVTVCSIVKTRKVGSAYREKGTSNMELAKTAVKGSLILLPLLGLTWVFGLFAVNTNTSLFSWLFTIVNSLQGLFIFLVHVARNEYVVNSLKETFQKLTRRRTHRKESTYSTKSTEVTGKSTDISFSDPLPERNNSLTTVTDKELESILVNKR